MCGITGLLELPPRSSEVELAATARAMAAPLRHRGPDDAGWWVDAEVGVALGFRRLAVLDLSDTGKQPMVSACRGHVLVFNGEIYNFPELRKDLEQEGVAFRGSSDTEVLLAAMARWGVPEAVRRANGMFAFAHWDVADRRLTLGRDRLGEKPLYYGWAGETLLFGSELKALRAHPRFGGEVDREALTLYLRFGYVPAPWSIYRGVRKLPPGTLLSVPGRASAPRPEPEPYWSAWEVAERGVADPLDVTPDEATDAVEALLRESVGMRMVADVPLGAFLSGGVDSSTVVALMQAQSERPVRTFTIGFGEGGYDESEDAERVARHLATDHTTLRLTPAEAQAVIPRLPIVFDEPFADSSQVPMLLVSELARRDVTVSLSGDGGDELFGGYFRYLAVSGRWQRLHRLPAAVRAGLARALTAVPADRWSRLLDAARPLLPAAARQAQPGDKLHKLALMLGRHRPEEAYADLVGVCADARSLVVGGSEPPTPLSDPSLAPALGLPALAMYLDAVTYLPDDILVKVDRASMATSLEARVPLLDHRLFELAWALPLSVKLVDGQGKWVLRRVLERYVPAALVDRPKMGFGVPIGSWLRGPLRPWAEDLLSEHSLSAGGLLDAHAVRHRWSEHVDGRRDRKHELWAVLMFQAWLAGGP